MSLLSVHTWGRRFFTFARKGAFLLKNMSKTGKGSFFHSSSVWKHEERDLSDVPRTINVTFITKEGEEVHVKAKEGERALYLAHSNGVDLEGACEASLACTTCHVYVESEHLELPEASEEEEDLLDMAPFLRENSRLGCQIILSKDLDGIVLRLPRATKNFYVDGHKPQPH